MTQTVTKWMSLLTLAALPLYVIRFEIAGLPTTLLEIVLCLTMVSWVVWQLRRISEWKRPKLQWSWAVLIGVFVLASVISVFVADATWAALGLWRAYVAWPLMLAWIIYTVFRAEPIRSSVTNIVIALSVGGLIVSTGALLQWLGAFPIPDIQYEGLNGAERRMTSIYPYPAAIGLLLTPIIAANLTIITGYIKRHVYSRALWLHGLSALLGVVAIALAKTDGAIVALGVVCAILTWRLIGVKWTALILLLGVVALLVSPVRDRAVDVVTFQDNSGQVRLVLWQGTWNMVQDHPLLGVGLGGFTDSYDHYRLEAHAESTILYPHTFILTIWTELGMLGIISVLGLVGVFALVAWRYRGHDSAQIAALMMVSTLVYGLVDVPIFKNDLAVVWWIPFVMMWLMQHQVKTLQKRR